MSKRINSREAKNIRNKIISLKIELEEKYTDYYSVDIGYEYLKFTYGKSIESYKMLDLKRNLLCDINYLNDEIRNLEDKLSVINLSNTYIEYSV